jgi:uncharacterized membrane protein YgdD (TMEM256/DUF423 family)
MGANLWLLIGAVSGFVSVAAGAFGAHGLRARVSPDMLAVFETGARYQMYHALLLCLVAVVAGRAGAAAAGTLSLCGGLLIAGTVLFSGSLYALALTGQRSLGAITPLGGLCFLAAWAVLALAALRGTLNAG